MPCRRKWGGSAARRLGGSAARRLGGSAASLYHGIRHRMTRPKPRACRDPARWPRTPTPTIAPSTDRRPKCPSWTPPRLSRGAARTPTGTAYPVFNSFHISAFAVKSMKTFRYSRDGPTPDVPAGRGRSPLRRLPPNQRPLAGRARSLARQSDRARPGLGVLKNGCVPNVAHGNDCSDLGSDSPIKPKAASFARPRSRAHLTADSLRRTSVRPSARSTSSRRMRRRGRSVPERRPFPRVRVRGARRSRPRNPRPTRGPPRARSANRSARTSRGRGGTGCRVGLSSFYPTRRRAMAAKTR